MAKARKIKPEHEAEAKKRLEAGDSYRDMVRWYESLPDGDTTTPTLWARMYREWFGGQRSQKVEPSDPDGWQFFAPWARDEDVDTDESILLCDDFRYDEWWEKYRFLSALRALWMIEEGMPLQPESVVELALVRDELAKSDSVIDMIPGEGDELPRYVAVPRRKGIDKGWIRDPFLDDDGCPVPFADLVSRVWWKVLGAQYSSEDLAELAKPPLRE